MARLVTCGWETGAVSEGWNSAASAPATVTANFTTVASPVRSGAFALQEATLGSAPVCPILGFAGGTLEQDFFVRLYVYATALPATGAARIVGTNTLAVGAPYVEWATVSANLVIRIRSSATASPALALNTWHLVEWRFRNSASAAGQSELWVNGTLVEVQSGLTASAASANLILGTDVANQTASFLFDDLALNDTTGSNETSYPTRGGKIVMLKPTSDNAVGTGWTTDSAGATNLWDALNNTPPTGVADTTAGAGTHQIRNATANANVNEDAKTQTYAAAGVPTGARIILVQPIVNTSAPSATSAKAGAVLVVSNPATPSTTLGPLGTSGAFWGGVAAGTFPVGWAKWTRGTPVYYPAGVVLSTSPVVRIQQVTSSTLIAMADSLGVLVEFEAAAPALAVGAALMRAATR